MADTNEPSLWEIINPFDPDAGLNIRTVPVIGNFFEKDSVFGAATEKFEDNPTQNAVNSGIESKLVKGAGGVAGGLLGYKFGSNFGSIGKVAGGVIGAWLGSKLSAEVANDFAAAKDYCSKDNNAKFLKTFASNLLTFNGQSYDGHTTVNSEPDV